jgi:hypothetical protein
VSTWASLPGHVNVGVDSDCARPPEPHGRTPHLASSGTPVLTSSLLAPRALASPAIAAFLLLAACMTPPRMCASEADCGGQGAGLASCVAGRCVAHGATAAIDTARRLLFLPVEVAWVRPRGDERGAATATLGRSGDEAIVLSRFSASLPPEANVLEAYLVLERPAGIDTDPAPVVLHAAPIVDRWDGGSVSWARQPRIEEIGAPVTRVFAASGPLVRLDVRLLVQRWRRRAREDFGVAIVAEGESPTGIVVALAPGVGQRYDPVLGAVFAPPVATSQPFEKQAGATSSSLAEPGADLVGPRLEIYVR